MKPLRLVVSSMELARVVETTNSRNFTATNDDGSVCDLTYYIDKDRIDCLTHIASDDCTGSARVRLCGCLTNSVAPDVLTRPKLETK